MLNHNQSVTGIPQFHKHLQQLFDICEMQAGGRFIENIYGAPSGFLGQFGRQFNPLRLASGERCPGLTEAQIAESHIQQSS